MNCLSPSARLNGALLALVRGDALTDSQRAELDASGWRDITPRGALAELREQQKRGALAVDICLPERL